MPCGKVSSVHVDPERRHIRVDACGDLPSLGRVQPPSDERGGKLIRTELDGCVTGSLATGKNQKRVIGNRSGRVRSGSRGCSV
jgi:hypothetical protein